MRINSLLFIKQRIFSWDSLFPVEDSNQVLQLLNMRQRGIQLRDCFMQNRLVSGVTLFHSPMKRNNLKLFTSTGRTIKMKTVRETSILKVNRNIMPNIISWSVKSGKAVYVQFHLVLPIQMEVNDQQLKPNFQRVFGFWVFEMPSFQTYHSKLMPIFSSMGWKKYDLCMRNQTLLKKFP